MKESGKEILIALHNRWKLRLFLEIVLYAIGPTILCYFLGFNWIWTLGLFFCLLLILTVIKKPWRSTLNRLASYIDQKMKSVEHSSSLLLQPPEQLSSLARLQSQKVLRTLVSNDSSILPIKGLKRASIAAFLCIGIGFLFSKSGIAESLWSTKRDAFENGIIDFRPVDSLAVETLRPKVESQKVIISYPSYTGKRPVTTSNMNIRALEGSRLTWNIKFDSQVDSVILETNDKNRLMRLTDGFYIESSTLKEPGFYNFRFTDARGGTYASDLYALEVIRDQPPSLEIQGIKPFEAFEFAESKHLKLTALINDDYGIAAAEIIATVSKGSGESVKFREEKLAFDTEVIGSKKSLELSKKIDLDMLEMEPGDELYFYVEVLDTKRPTANSSRSETFFAVIKDTVSNHFAVEGTMGADLMPDYFRSQRQLIIDTEKLIADKGQLTEHEFNSTSNELGFDQKALRLKYGEFMGDEADSGIQGGQPSLDDDHSDTEDPLAEFTHDHDGDNEHNLVDHEHEEDDEENVKGDPLHDYLHNHDDPEESTLFTQSLKSKLQQAMAEMWDAELHLRLYTPEKSLPYQYKALKLIQEIKNSARIYVHRIGFDPPPIKEEVRLTGDIDEVNTFQKKAELEITPVYPNIREAIKIIEKLKNSDIAISQNDRSLFKMASNELAGKAIEEPGKYLSTLQGLKWLTEDIEITKGLLNRVQEGLFSVIPRSDPYTDSGALFTNDLDNLLLKELETYD
ncbi:DUF4175 family protein [Maribacter algicola]|uniref:DUF4175 family protein n=1 Tax=Meishania litoralis TaxID=3434685 RepID=A0ACC7LJ94_9FLAO